jgi:hypothetical protein
MECPSNNTIVQNCPVDLSLEEAIIASPTDEREQKMSKAQYSAAIQEAKANVATAQADPKMSLLRKAYYIQMYVDIQRLLPTVG